MADSLNQDDILSNLYSLRAGISYIASETEIYDIKIANANSKLNNIIEKENGNIQLCENELKNIEEQLRKPNNEIWALENDKSEKKKQLNELNDKVSAPKERVKRCKRALNCTIYRERRTFFAWLTIAIILTLCTPIVGLIGYLKEILWLFITGISGGGTLAMIAWGVFAGSCNSLNEAISYHNDEKHELERAKDDYSRCRNGVFDKQIKELENEISVINEQITLISQQQSDKKEQLLTNIHNAKRKLNIANYLRNDNILQAQQVYRSECAVAYEHHIIKCKRVLNALTAIYSPMLDIRDWQNLDFLIYNIETKRADTIKEALLLTDTERRNNRLIAEIKNASSSIGKSIHNGLSYLQSGISSNLKEISRNISNHNNALNELSSSMQKQTDEINSSIDNAVSEAVLRDALMSEANKTSYELLEQVTKLKELAETKNKYTM